MTRINPNQPNQPHSTKRANVSREMLSTAEQTTSAATGAIRLLHTASAARPLSAHKATRAHHGGKNDSTQATTKADRVNPNHRKQK